MRRLAALALVVIALAACGSDRPPRASGVTERWLQAVSDTGRDRVREDATERASVDGSVEVARPLLAPDHDDDETWFADLEVGKAVEKGDEARVPLRVTRSDDDGELYRTAVLARTSDGWHIIAIDDPLPGERVPSNGGSRPATAQGRHWLTAIAFGVLVTVASALTIEMQPAESSRDIEMQPAESSRDIEMQPEPDRTAHVPSSSD